MLRLNYEGVSFLFESIPTMTILKNQIEIKEDKCNPIRIEFKTMMEAKAFIIEALETITDYSITKRE